MAEDMDFMAKKLREILPESLDAVITRNREFAGLRIATQEDIDALHCETEDTDAVTGTVSRWTLITLELNDDQEGQRVWVFLTGYNETRQAPWMTSRVVGIDRRTGLLTTQSGSLYRINGPCSNDPDLPYICATFNAWGLGPYLGIPPFFF